MISKDQFAQSFVRECDIIVHLFSKIAPDAYDYQPSPSQRTTLALLRYLTICATAGIHCLVESDWKQFAPFSARVKEMTAFEFPEAMERQKQEILDFFANVSEETLLTKEAPMPGGGMLPLGAAILNGPLKWLAAYKMQLFLYAKASGATELKTSNLWRGVDPKPPA
ncbi:MAG TPA: hypothetical protein VGQ76_17670 [Thermoanaerobaculia bacterium]|jgi:hypothetical protein|nr:hypothetical protein [Thermoanaerobaculia bacterium]